MAWLGKLSVSDFTGAVNKLSESVKNIEKNFDSALGFESSEGREGKQLHRLNNARVLDSRVSV